MIRLATILAAVLLTAVLLLLAVWQVPQWLDWTRYRTTIEVLASTTLGQTVTIHGPVSLTLLPEPILTASQVDIGAAGATPLSIHVAALRLRVALLPLLGGRVDARELVLGGPDLHIAWPAQPGTLRLSPPSWLAAFAARIENGRLTIGRLAFTGIDATLASLDTGALTASGTAQFSGQSWHFTTRLTAAGADGSAGLDVTLEGQGKANGLGARFSGQLARDGTLAGTISSRGPDLALLLPTPPVPFRADGRLTAGSGLVAVDDLALELGGSPASAAVALRVSPNQRLDIALSAGRLDFDTWLPVLLGAGTKVAGFDLPIGIDFSAESAPLGGGTLQHVRAAFDLLDNTLVVRDATARLPGNATLWLSGRVDRSDPAHPRFEGDGRLDAPVLRTTLGWFDKTIPGTPLARVASLLPNGVAQRVNLTAHVSAAADGITLRQLAGTLDDVPITGGLSLKRGERPAIIADITANRLALDPWLPSRLPGLAELASATRAFDAELKLDAAQATLGGSAIDSLEIDGALESGSVVLRRFEGTVGGALILLSGNLGADGKLTGGAFSLRTTDATPLADMLPAVWRATPALWHGPARLDVQAAGPPNALAVSVNLTLADARTDIAATLDLPSLDWTGTITLRHPGARRFVSALGLPEQMDMPALPEWLGDGSLSLVAHLSGAPGRLTASTFELAAGGLHADGDLAFDTGAGEPRLSGHLHADTLMLPVPDSAASAPLPLDVLRGWQGNVQLGVNQLVVGQYAELRDASASLLVEHGALRLRQFKARLGSGSMTGSLAFDVAAPLPDLTLQGRLAEVAITGPVSGAAIDLQSGQLGGAFQLDAKGYSPSTMLATLDGHLALTVADGTVSGFDLLRLKQAVGQSDPVSAEAAAGAALHGGTTSFGRLVLNASLAHGDLMLDNATLGSDAGEAHATGSMHLATQTLDAQIMLRPSLPDPPDVAIRLIGAADHPDTTVELAGLARWMAALVH